MLIEQVVNRKGSLIKRLIFILYVVVISTGLPQNAAGQGASSVLSDKVEGAISPGMVSEKGDAQSRINLNVKDTSLRDILWMISQQGKRQIVFDNSLVQLDRRLSIQLKDMSVMDAVVKVLAGSGLQAVPAKEGGTIVVRLPKPLGDTVSAKREGQVIGRVIDSATKEGLTGVTIQIQGINKDAVSDRQGSFVVRNVPVGKYILNAKAVGYQTQSVSIVVESVVDTKLSITLRQATTTLSEVVTTATGQQRRVEIANDIVKINADQIRERAPVRSVVDLLEAAQVPGVLVTRAGGDPGAASRIRIRGIGSISQSNDPVVIVDGVWIDASTSRLDDLDPGSIETVEIVRGPSAATLYGQDAANGVIVITTKKGQVGPTRWTLSYNRDWGETYGKDPLFYVGVGTTHLGSTNQQCPIASVLKFQCRQDSVLVFDPNNSLLSREGTETNNRFVAQMDGGAPNVNYAITLSSGNTIGVRRIAEIEKIRYGMFGYRPTSEFSTPSELRRNNITTAITFNPAASFTMGLTITGTQSTLKDNFLSNRWNGLTLVGSSSFRYSLDTAFGPFARPAIAAIDNPVKTTNGMIAASVQYRPGSNYTVNGNAGVEKNSKTDSKFERNTICTRSNGCADSLGRRRELSENISVYTVRLNASTSLNLGRLNRFFDIRPSVGGDFKKTDLYMVSLEKDSIAVGDRSISLGRLITSNNIAQENAIAGWFINSTIGLFSRIYFDVGVRQDIGSAITSTNDAVYPKIGGSWLVSDEPFWRHNNIINSFRLRSAIGHSAVQPDVADIDGKFVHNVEYIKGNFVSTVDLNALGNSRLRPERSVEVELGFDIDMLDDRFNLVGTYAQKDNRNTLVVRNMPPSFGSGPFGSRKENVAKVRNRNFELSATGRAIETDNISLALNYALTLSDNKVVTLGNGITPFSTTGEDRIAAGYPLAAAWGRKVLGYRDRNGDGLLAVGEVILSDSLVYIGWSQPRYRASYGVSFSLNNQFVFDSRFAYQSRYAQQYSSETAYGSENMNASLADQAAHIIPNISGKRPVSDLRWNSASITYHLPQSLLKRFSGRRVSVSLQGSNLGLWTNYIGRDPSINTFIGLGDSFGDSGVAPPRPRLYVLDFKVGF